MTKKISLTPEVIECVDVNGECYGNAEERLKLAQELLCMQDMLSTFIPEGGAQ